MGDGRAPTCTPRGIWWELRSLAPTFGSAHLMGTFSSHPQWASHTPPPADSCLLPYPQTHTDPYPWSLQVSTLPRVFTDTHRHSPWHPYYSYLSAHHAQNTHLVPFLLSPLNQHSPTPLNAYTHSIPWCSPGQTHKLKQKKKKRKKKKERKPKTKKGNKINFVTPPSSHPLCLEHHSVQTLPKNSGLPSLEPEMGREPTKLNQTGGWQEEKCSQFTLPRPLLPSPLLPR